MEVIIRLKKKDKAYFGSVDSKPAKAWQEHFEKLAERLAHNGWEIEKVEVLP